MNPLLIILFCLALLLPVSAWGASCTNVKTGTWATYSTWSSATCRHTDKPVPGSGAFANYSAIIKSGTVVTVDDSRTIYTTCIGTAVSGQIGHLIFDGGANDITITSAGSLTFTVNTNTTSKLTLNAGVTWDLGTWLIIAGTNNVYDVPRWDWLINGTAERRVIVNSSRYIYALGTFSRGAINWNYATLNGFTAGTNTLNLYYGVTLKNCLFKSASANTWTFGTTVTRIRTAAPIDIANTDFRTAGNVIFFTEAGAATGTRLVKDSTFATTATTSSRPTLTIQGNDRWGGRLTFDHCVFYHYHITETNSAGNTFNNCAFYIGPHSAGASEIIGHGGDGDTITNNLFYTSNNNNHGFMGSSVTSGVVPLGPNTYRNNVVENVYNTDTANIIIPSTTAGITVENNLFIGTGLNAVTFGLRGGKAVATSAVNTITNNTFSWWGSGYYWEHGTAGTPQNGTNIFKNNLMYANLNTVFGMIEGNTGPSTGQLDDADYNAFYRTGTTPYIRNMALANWTEETRGTLTYLSATSFRVAGVDVTGTYTAGKVLSIRIGTKRAWVKCHATTPSAYSGGDTTVTLAADYGALTSGLTAIYYTNSNKTYGVDDGWGLHDLYANPNFLDSSRLLSGYTGSTAVAFFDELVKLNGYDTSGTTASRSNSWSVVEAITWLKGGYTPTNPVFATASDTGSYLGAFVPETIVQPNVWQRIFKSRIFR